MRTAAWETAPQTALINCSGEAAGRVSIYVTLVKWVHAIKHSHSYKVAAGHKEQMSLLIILVLF